MIVRVLASHGAKASYGLEHHTLLEAARSDNTAHLALLSAAGARFAVHNYDKVPSVPSGCTVVSAERDRMQVSVRLACMS